MKTLLKYYKKRKAAVNDLLEKPARAYTPATFHDLRVEIKKLNALTDLLNYCSEDFKRKKIFRPFKIIFRQAGKVRELQVEQAMLRKYCNKNSLNEYWNKLKLNLHTEHVTFFTLLTEKIIEQLKKSEHKLIPFIKENDKKEAADYISSKEEKIKKLLKQNTLQLHELRKCLKQLNYNRKSLDLDSNFNVHQADELSSLLGKWHDCRVVAKHLEKVIMSGRINSGEINELKKIKAKLLSYSVVLVHKIKGAIPLLQFSII